MIAFAQIAAIALAWLIVSAFACIIAGRFFAAGNPADDRADRIAKRNNPVITQGRN
jgi:hypothetical protein